MLEPTRATFTKVTLYTGTDGRARFREDPITLSEGSAQSMLSTLMPSTGMQLRESPVGFRSEFHCTGSPQWVCKPREHFASGDMLPPGAGFDATTHGHWSRQRGTEPLVTLFVRA